MRLLRFEERIPTNTLLPFDRRLLFKKTTQCFVNRAFIIRNSRTHKINETRFKIFHHLTTLKGINSVKSATRVFSSSALKVNENGKIHSYQHSHNNNVGEHIVVEPSNGRISNGAVGHEHQETKENDKIDFNFLDEDPTDWPKHKSRNNEHETSFNGSPSSPKQPPSPSSTESLNQKSESSFRGTYKRPKGVTHYDVIGVKFESNTQEIRKAYILKARELHPDVNTEDPDTAEKFVDLQLAYQILSDPKKRSDYDQTLKPEKEQRTRYTITTKVEYWQKQWEAETLEQKAERRERYKRFATGEFKDPEGMTFINHNWGEGWTFLTAAAPIVLAFVGFYKLGITTRDVSNEYDDVICTADWKGAKYTDSYLNPFTMEWCSLKDGQEPPTPDELRMYYFKNFGPLVINQDLYPSKVLTRIKMPSTQTTLPVLYRDIKTDTLLELVYKKKRQGSYVPWDPLKNVDS